MKSLVDISINPPPSEPTNEPPIDPLTKDSGLEFTEQEQEGFYIVRAILSSLIEPKRVTHKDTANYCNILLDNNGWRQIVRFHFNNSANLKLEIYSMNDDGKKSSEKVSIKAVSEIYQYANKFKAIVTAYEAKATAK